MKLRLMTLLGAAAIATTLVQAQAPASIPAPTAARQQAKNAKAKKLRAKRAKVRAEGKANALNLTPEQKQKNQTIRQQAQLTAQPVRQQLIQNRQALAAAVKAGDTAKVQALSQQQGALRGQALATRSQAQSQIYAGLTNEQREKLDALRQKRAARGFAN